MEILYKYVTADRAMTCIPEVGDATLRATQPAALNDPFECAVMPLYVIREASEENRLLAEALTEINENAPVTEQDVDQSRQRYGSLFTRQMFANQISTKLGIVSFTANPLHPLMWSHYTIDGSGFVIGYDKAELPKLVGDEGTLAQVQYSDRLVPIRDTRVLSSPKTNALAILALKSDHWRYENEWRLIVEMTRTIGTGQTDRHGQPINLVRVPNEAVVRVYYTERTPQCSVEIIRKRLTNTNNRYRAGPPRKLIMAPTSYGYEEAPE